ncbi:hypothetical protein C1I95_20195 [Micromonospora craterilacus]|uniref:Uncharacterized protein n=1 Tax=Micromonospora craterilacus TaxID=1655439 RepID=A0A2W2DT32_9ACTN|nr:hypothetical protein [Micromonospora craterilacus]PZG15162.1 hypothetical protein C1I95_20195 [Micromonospora craterilacus]
MPAVNSTHDPHRDLPEDVTDVLLWRTAARVIAAHQPQPGRPTCCVSLLCAGQHYPCPPVRAADRAQQLSRRRVPVASGTFAASAPARGRVPVAGGLGGRPPRQRFADWHTAIQAAINPRRARGRSATAVIGRVPSTAFALADPARVGGVSAA